ncbi:hypothetical protein [uncultured Pseudoteredinibacter sp.]|uniref:hypothetical protein n=1 Tax=uncultured Pseudoteredinibacter sp. TaxID=1641701 RepID=UPI0026070B28|nr:hypothetical protein [uncultured Pseudoteredinibacter sp.]
MFSLNRLVLLVFSLLYFVLASSVVVANELDIDPVPEKQELNKQESKQVEPKAIESKAVESGKIEKKEKDQTGKDGKPLRSNDSGVDKESSNQTSKPAVVESSGRELASEQQWQDWLKDSQRQFGVGVSGSVEEKINILDKSNLLDDPSGVLAEEELDEGI